MEKSREKTKYRKKIENIKTTEENKRKGDEQKKKKKRAEVMKKEVQMTFLQVIQLMPRKAKQCLCKNRNMLQLDHILRLD